MRVFGLKTPAQKVLVDGKPIPFEEKEGELILKNIAFKFSSLHIVQVMDQ